MVDPGFSGSNCNRDNLDPHCQLASRAVALGQIEQRDYWSAMRLIVAVWTIARGDP
jgi:hypothetical protein